MSINLEQKINWAKENKDQIIIVFAVIVFLIALVPLLLNYTDKKDKQNLKSYAMLQSNYYQKHYENSLKESDVLLSNLGKKNKLRPLVLLMKANSLYETQKYVESETVFRDLLQNYPKHYLAPNFIDSLAYCLEMQGKYSDAISVWQKVIDEYSDNYLIMNAYKSIARNHELFGDYKKAEEIYRLMNGMFVSTDWGEFAKARLNFLTLAGKIQITNPNDPNVTTSPNPAENPLNALKSNP